MRIIDLLNKIANGEITEIPRFIFEGKCYNQCNNFEKFNMFKTYYYVDNKATEYTTLESIFDIDNLNRLIVIEEDKKIPEKLKKKKTINGSFEGKTTYIYKYNEYEIGETINEIIDYLDYLKNKGE